MNEAKQLGLLMADDLTEVEATADGSAQCPDCGHLHVNAKFKNPAIVFCRNCQKKF